MVKNWWKTRRAVLALGVGVVLGLLPLGARAQGAATAQVKFSGILGQSQATGSEAFPTIAVGGLVLDQAGKLWTSSADILYGFTRKADETGWTLTDKIKLPAAVNHLSMRWDGERLYAAIWNGTVVAVDLAQKTNVPAFKYSDKIRAFAVAPAGLTKGFAEKAKYFTLEDDVVSAFAKDGAPLGPVLNLTRPANATWWYVTLLVEPNTGDL
ncbi:MAG TPA: hypothetical protein VGL77_10055, partial [Armatimonadota bacterium]